MALAVVLLISVYHSHAHGERGNADNVRYTLSPTASGTAWNSNLGLKDGVFYGGKLGIDFGTLIGLETSYLTSGYFRTDFSKIGLLDTSGALVNDQRVKVRRFGGDLIVRWPSDRIAPFVKVGGGVVRFEPESGQKVEKIDVRLGGGLDYIVSSRLRSRAWVEMNRFRLDRYTLAPGGVVSGQYPLDTEAEKNRNNVSIGISLDYALGLSRFGASRPAQRVRPFSSLEIEPFVGRLNFDDSRMSTVTVAGTRIGGELNPWVGWGVYYWRGMESDLSDTEPLQSYGGEARFSLASKDGPQPYLTIGAGQLDFRSGYTDTEGMGRDDKTGLILGAGIRAEVLGGLQLNVSVRDLMYGEERLDQVSGADEISHNWIISGALVFGLGGRGNHECPAPLEHPPIRRSAIKTESASDTTIVDAQNNSADSAVELKAYGDTTRNMTPPVSQVVQAGYVSEKSVVIPVPLEGEIYIRYGKTSRDVGETVFKGASFGPGAVSDTVGRESVSKNIAPAVISESPTVAQPVDTLSPVPPASPTEPTPAPISRSELDSLIGDLKSELSAMLAAQAVKLGDVGVNVPSGRQPGVHVDSTVSLERDSVIATLRKELSASQQERHRLDSLLRAPAPVSRDDSDSVLQWRIEREITDQVAAALALTPEGKDAEITQADLQNMMAKLTARQDSVSSKRASDDAARLRDQLQLEIVRQTKSQEEFQRAMEEYMSKHGERQQDKPSTPPTIIVTQPPPAPQIIEKDEPSTVVIKPDTQYVVIRDSTGLGKTSLELTDLEAEEVSAETEFIDLRPAGYTGFGLEKPKQVLLGFRLDIGPITSKEKRLRLVPEFAFGFGGGGVSVMAVMNAEYAIADIETGNYRVIPYARMGFGVLGFGGDIPDRDTEGVLNFTYGISFDPKKTGLFGGIGDPALFLEHQIIDLFDVNRIAFGFQWSR